MAGAAAAERLGGRGPPARPAATDWPRGRASLVAQVRAAPDATLREHCAMGGDTGVGEPVDDVAGVAARGLAPQKKSLIAAERDEAARAAWREEAAVLMPADLVFVDETSTHTALTRRRARARGANEPWGVYRAITVRTSPCWRP